MRATQIDFKSLLPYAIQAYTEVFGEEYQGIIADKINSSIIIPYDDIQGLETYIEFRKNWKKIIMILDLLQEIGMNIKALENYFDSVDQNSFNIINTLFGGVSNCFNEYWDEYNPIRAFKNNDCKISDKIELFNYLRGNKEPQITAENLEEFSKTQEYNEILSKIDKINEIYDELYKEYSSWKKAFCEEDLQFIEKEKTRKKALLNKIREEIWKEIFPLLRSALKEKLANETLEKQIDIVLSHYMLGEEFMIEWFNQENMNKLSSPTISISEKRTIVLMQKIFLKNIGIKPPMNLFGDNLEKNLGSYLEFLNQDDVKQFIPSNEVMDSIKKLRERKDKEVINRFTRSREDFNNAWKIFSFNDEFYNGLANIINQKKVCVTHGYSGNTLIPLVFYTIRTSDRGALAYSFIHEIAHVINRMSHACGFDFHKRDNNPYDNAYRKYERFNETVTDIFAIEALRLLNEKNIFLLESKSITDLSYDNGNTSFITQNLLKPLIKMFRKRFIKSYLHAQPQVLTECIGEDNFEDLVDVVNKVDFLTRNGLTEEKIEKEPQNPMVIEYNKQLERIKRIYQSIDEYYTNYCSSLEEKEQKLNS